MWPRERPDEKSTAIGGRNTSLVSTLFPLSSGRLAMEEGSEIGIEGAGNAKYTERKEASANGDVSRYPIITYPSTASPE
jgi:hypothetical protein